MGIIKKQNFICIFIIALLFVFLSTIGSFATITYPIKVGSSIPLTVEDIVQYGESYSKAGTYRMYIKLPNDSKKRNAYCMQPWLDNPGAGKRTVSAIYDQTTKNEYAEAIRTMMYYSQSYSGSSWANSNWFINKSGTKYDMAWVSSENEKIAIMHIATAMAYYQWKNAGVSLAKMPCYSGGTVKANTYEKYWNAACCIYKSSLKTANGKTGTFKLDDITVSIPSKAPSSFAVGLIKINGKQDLVFGILGVQMTGKVKLTKSSKNKAYTNGNSEYNFKNIEYSIFKNSSCTSKATDKKLTPNGSAISLDVGTYYVKETKTNSRYKLDNTAHKVVISLNNTKTISLSDVPETTTVSFNKTSVGERPKNIDLSGFKFIITGEWSINAPTFEAISNENGRVCFNNIPFGKYKLIEDVSSIEQKNKTIEKGFFRKGTTIDCEVDVKGSTDCLISQTKACNPFISEPTELSINVSKMIVDKNNNPLASLSSDGFSIHLNGVSNDGEKVDRKLITDKNGNAIFEEVPLGTYKIAEELTSEQEKYYTILTDEKTIVLDKKDEFVNIKNMLSISKLLVNKTSTDNNIEGIGFTLSGKDFQNNLITPVEAFTNESGKIDFGEILPGSYYIEETGFDNETYKFQDKYKLSGYSNPVQKVDITGKEENGVELNFENKNYTISLTKNEILEDGTETNNPIEGAEFALFYVSQDTEDDGTPTENEYQCSDTVATDSEGKVSFQVKKGTYRVREITVPGGYRNTNQNDYEDIVISDNNSDATVSNKALTFNRRDYGSISIYKYDKETNYPIPDAQFGLYRDSDCTDLIEKFELTNDRGESSITGLKWGTYYIKEVRTPKGYQSLNEIIETKIGRWYDTSNKSYSACVDAEISITNEQIKGNIELKKINAETKENIRDNSATFNLYKSSGDIVLENLKTDEDGILKVSNIEWGGYYFEEVKPPNGYGLQTEPIRFTVNSYSVGKDICQEVVSEDFALSNSIVATKSILASDILYEHGTPTFVFTLSGVDINGNKHTYNKPITFSEEYVKKHTNLDGTITMSTTFTNIVSGEYILSESDVDRYEFKSISNVSTNGEINGKGVKFDLTHGEIGKEEIGYATFNNIKTNWNDYSDQTGLVNAIKKMKRYTALKVDYFGEASLDGNMPFTEKMKDEYLKVYAIYDDGTERQLNNTEYVLTDQTGNLFSRTPKTGGMYSVIVMHEERGTIKQDTFSFEVKPPVRISVSFITNGGTTLDSITDAYKYDTLLESVSSASQYTTTKTGYWFGDKSNIDPKNGWYLDKECKEKFDLNTPILQENIMLYAKWTKKDLSECTWKEIEEIGNGEAKGTTNEKITAEEFFKTDFYAVKNDLSDDSLLTASVLAQNTKSFNYNGNTYHAMIAGFNHDVASDGKTTGISFISYESLGKNYMESTSKTNIIGWNDSTMRITTLPSVFNNLNADLRNVIVETKKSSINNLGTVVITNDKLFIPSIEEIYGAYAYSTIP